MNDSLTRASSLAGVDAPMPDAAFKPPTFSQAFKSEMFPDFDGVVELRFPTFGDEVEVERRTLARGAGYMARQLSYLEVCLVKAPASWWRPGLDGQPPLPAPDRLPDSAAVMRFVTAFLKWRDSFRSGVPAEPDKAPE